MAEHPAPNTAPRTVFTWWYRARESMWSRIFSAAPAVLVTLICCGLPLVWTAAAILCNPGLWSDLRLTPFRVELLARTLGCNILVAVVAVVLGLPAAFVMGRGRGRVAGVMWVLALGTLTLPSLALGYGWNQVMRLSQPMLSAMGFSLSPGGVTDTLRCVWILASWLWGIPACIVGLHLRRLDPDLQLAAALFGAARRATFRMLLGPIVASLAIVLLLATQEFAVYEPSGVSVMATEIRMVFATGAFSSLPIHGTGVLGPDQRERAAAAMMTALPLLAAIGLLAVLAIRASGRLALTAKVHVGDWPPILDAGAWARRFAVGVAVVCGAVPLAALVFSLRTIDTPQRLWSEFAEPLGGSGFVFAVVASIALAAALSASAIRVHGVLGLSIVSFLLGGEMAAIALIRISSPPWMTWARDSSVLHAVACLGRFLFVALAVAAATWSPAWEDLRMQARLYGAGPLRTAMNIVWPLAWPALCVGALLVGTLSLTEVSATGTLIPQHPPVLTNKLLAWAHAARSDRMIEGSLLTVALVGIMLSAILLALRTSRRRQTL